MEEDKVDLMLTIEDLKIIEESLKGALVRQNSMNFKYLHKITKLGKFVEEVLEMERGD